jgi:uncharacterized protein YdeI (BOF family)
MNKQVGAIVVSILFAVGTAVAAYAADTTDPMKGSDPKKVQEGVKGSDPGAAEAAKPMKPSDPKEVKEGVNATPEGGTPRSVVTGELLKIDGKDYVVKDQSGKEVRFQIDERTRMNANPKVGDKIRAKVEPQGYAYSINLASDSTEAGTPDKQTSPPSKSDLPEPTKK